ncbi:MAG TPA: acyl carrier protein [Pseudonocardiaceae bacterium]
MTSTEIAADVERLIRELMPALPAGPISPSATFQDLGMDSLKLVDLLGAAEYHFSVEVPDEEVGSFVQVSDLTDFVLRAG